MSGNIENIKVRKLVYAEQDGNVIDMEVLFEGREHYLPFSANPKDPVSIGREIYAKAIAGEYGEISPYVHNEAREIFNSTISFSAFRKRFTNEELVSIRTATVQIPELYVAWEDFQIAGAVALSDSEVKEKMNLFYTHKVLTKKRIGEILKN